jgi:hypothetical protein
MAMLCIVADARTASAAGSASCFACRAETDFKIGVNHAQSRRDTVPDRSIFDSFGYRGPHHKAAPPTSSTRKIDRQRRIKGKHQAFGHGTVLGESLTRRGQADLPITRERLEIDRVLVTECRIEAGRKSMSKVVPSFLDLLADGMTDAEPLAEYPQLADEDVLAAIAYGAEAARERIIPVPTDPVA